MSSKSDSKKEMQINDKSSRLKFSDDEYVDYVSTIETINTNDNFMNNNQEYWEQRTIKLEDESQVRDYYADPKAQQEAKESDFEGKTTVKDAITGQDLYKTQEEAKLHYPDDWEKHVAESDHIVPVKHIYDKHKDHAFVSKEKAKEIINSKKNFQQTSKSNNASKGKKTNEDYLNKKDDVSKYRKETRTERGKQIEKEIDREIFIENVKGGIEVFHDAGLKGLENSAISSVTASGILNLAEVIKGNKDFETAAKDTAVSTVKAGAKSYLQSGAMAVLQRTLATSSSKICQQLAACNAPAKVIMAVQVAGSAVKQLLNKEISMSECTQIIAKNAASMVIASEAALIGQAMIPIPIVGAAVGSLVGMLLADTVFSFFQSREIQRAEFAQRAQRRRMCEQACAQLREYRESFTKLANEYLDFEVKFYFEALTDMKKSLEVNDHLGVAESANNITRHLGGKPTINSFEGFCDFLNS
jgi:hypothetical protein